MIKQNTVIPKGLQMHIDTWENDGDNYKTQVLSGLTKEDILFYIDILNLFGGSNLDSDGKMIPDFGNDDIHHSLICNYIASIMDNHSNISLSVKDVWTESLNDNYSMVDAIYNILGAPVECEYGFCRVFEDFRVYNIPEEIIFVDITDEFK